MNLLEMPLAMRSHRQQPLTAVHHAVNRVRKKKTSQRLIGSSGEGVQAVAQRFEPRKELSVAQLIPLLALFLPMTDRPQNLAWGIFSGNIAG